MGRRSVSGIRQPARLLRHEHEHRPSHHLGEPQISGPLAVYPIFGPQPGLRYRSIAHAIERGAYVTELDGRASDNNVLITNASDQGVLLTRGS